jgi:N-succinyldiaminopimelate aminotransferase
VFARELYAQQNVTVLPGSYLSREAHSINPGSGYVRIALVAPLDECIDAAERIRSFVNTL